jgi:hypothetical protein
VTKSILALFLVASLAPVGAYAQRGAMLPPPEYDGLFTGDLTIKRLLTQNDVRAACPNTPFGAGAALACAIVRNESCEIYIVADGTLKAFGLTYALTLRHELGHCNGWPADHRGARYVDPYPKTPGIPTPIGPTPPYLQFPR